MAIVIQASVSIIPDEAIEDYGTYRVTEYCQSCNDPCGHQSASGIHLEAGHVAMNGVPLGTEIELDGRRYTVVDRCGIDGTVDIFKESEECNCNRMNYRKITVVISKEKENERKTKPENHKLY